MSTYDEEEGRQDRIHEIKFTLGPQLNQLPGVACDPWRLRDDLYVVGPLSKIIEWAQDYRSEIEELG